MSSLCVQSKHSTGQPSHSQSVHGLLPALPPRAQLRSAWRGVFLRGQTACSEAQGEEGLIQSFYAVC